MNDLNVIDTNVKNLCFRHKRKEERIDFLNSKKKLTKLEMRELETLIEEVLDLEKRLKAWDDVLLKKMEESWL